MVNCNGCVAKTYAAFRHPEQHQLVFTCWELRASGHCQLQLACDLAERQIAAMNNLADALRGHGSRLLSGITVCEGVTS